MSKPVEDIESKLSLFKKFVDLVRGTPDINQRIKVLADPETVETMTRLSPDQIDVVEICADIDDYFPEFAPMKKDCETMMKANISLDGQGRIEVTQFEMVENLIKIASSKGLFAQADQQQTQEKPERKNETKE